MAEELMILTGPQIIPIMARQKTFKQLQSSQSYLLRIKELIPLNVFSFNQCVPYDP